MKNYKYESKIEHTGNSEFPFYALIVCIDLKTGYERVIRGYNGKFFKTLNGAEKSTQKKINQILASQEY